MKLRSYPGARIWNLDLVLQPPPEEEFEIIVTVMTLHHISRLEGVLAGFARMLTKQRYLCIVDLEEEDGSFHGDGWEGRQGFNQSELSLILADAGFILILADAGFIDARSATATA